MSVSRRRQENIKPRGTPASQKLRAVQLDRPEPVDEDQIARSVARVLYLPNPRIYWLDLCGSALIGWTSLVVAIRLPFLSLAMIGASVIAWFTLYRGLSLIHEIDHLQARPITGLEAAWNCLFGFPFLMPSFMYVGVHQHHHKVSTYGTKEDPEYLAFAASLHLTVKFVVQSLIVPMALAVRFLLLGPVGLVIPRFQNWLVVHASALTINPQYRRAASVPLVNKAGKQTTHLLLMWMGLIILLITAVVPRRSVAVWFAIGELATITNTFRALGSHAYASTGQVLSRSQQLKDSIDTPGNFWTELWAPVGLRYHALHHYFPGIPYHNLGTAYCRLMSVLPPSSAYAESTSPSLRISLLRLLRSAALPRSE